jgi:hypothetical protein
VLLAQGQPTESFPDMKDGPNYANRPGLMRLYPDYSARRWEAFGCARPVVTWPPQMLATPLNSVGGRSFAVVPIDTPFRHRSPR